MDKDKYIDEIADILQETDDKIRKTTLHDCATYGNFAEAIIDAGYRKADEVRKEVFEKIMEKASVFTTKGKSKNFVDGYTQAVSEYDERIKQVAKELGVEVDK